jgi:DNA-binding response OmpR family regulator
MSTLKVLHVEDETIVVDMVRQILRDQMEVDSAESLNKAISMISSNVYDLLLVDLNLEDSTGVETVRMLRPYSIPMVILSGLSTPEILAEAAEAGADDYLIKPGITPTRLINRLRFTHARFKRRMEYEKTEREKKIEQRKKYFNSETFEAIKPFISCDKVEAGKCPVFKLAR